MRPMAECGDQVVDGQRDHRATRGQAAAGDVRGQHHVAQRQQTWIYRRLAFEYIESRRRQSTAGQRIRQCLFIDDATARDVDQRRRRFHLQQCARIDEVMAFLRVRQHQHQMVGLLEQPIEAGV